MIFLQADKSWNEELRGGKAISLATETINPGGNSASEVFTSQLMKMPRREQAGETEFNPPPESRYHQPEDIELQCECVSQMF